MMRERGSSGEGTVWWITGLSGAGKSTVGRLVRDGLSARGRPVLVLDGDRLRAVLGETTGYGAKDRRRLSMTYGRLAREVAGQGIDAVCTTMSMFHAVREWNRSHIPRYREIYLRVPLRELEARDPRGLYARARRNTQGTNGSEVMGIDVSFEEPMSPDLVIDNFGVTNLAAAAARILLLDAR